MKTIANLELSSSMLNSIIGDQLLRLNPSAKFEFTDDVWSFSVNNGRFWCTLDFSLFRKSFVQFNKRVSIVYWNDTLSLTLEDFAKVIWLNAVADKAPTSIHYYGVFQALALLFSFLKEKRTDRLEVCDFKEFYEFFLTQDISQTGLSNRMSAPAYANRFGTFSLNHLASCLSRYGVTTVLADFTERRVLEAFNSACISQLDMTLSDYKLGGTFNYLGLDIGKHYIDHCSNVFEEYYAYASSINKTIEHCLDKRWFSNRVGISKKMLTQILGHLLCGECPEMLRAEGVRVTIEKLQIIEEFAHSIFRKEYQKSTKLVNTLSIDVINQIIERCSFPERYDTQEFVRTLLSFDLLNLSGKTKNQIFREYCAVSSTKDNVKSPMQLEVFEEISKSILDSHEFKLSESPLKLRNFLKEQFIKVPLQTQGQGFSGIKFLKFVTKKVADAGLTSLVALTGWRRGEYGFPLSSIDITLNNEPTDNYYSPYRFYVKWKVPKSGGNTLLSREITMSCYTLAVQLASLNCASIGEPALYATRDKESQKIQSELKVKSAVISWWVNFVEDYCLFKDIDSIEKRNPNAASLISSGTQELVDIRDELRRDLPAVKLTMSGAHRKTFGFKLRQFVAGELDLENTKILEQRLSKDTLAKLKTGTIKLTHSAVMSIRRELLGDAKYPSPHALRHVWAEAVLRRYQGDIGKFIRANFKHLNKRFFMSYLRDKEMMAIERVATRAVINSTVRKHITSLGDEYRNYAGGFDRFISKAVGLTKVVSHSEYLALASKISEKRIVSITVNPWSSCFLRLGTEKSAKCSIDGVVQQQNAEPKLCLGCINANIAKGNYEGIVVYIAPDIDACRETRLPYILKIPHIEVVKLALKRVTQLRDNSGSLKYDGFIGYLKETLDIVAKERSIS